MQNLSKITKAQRIAERHYSSLLEKHGPVPLGVDWPSKASQQLRLLQLLKICNFGDHFTINDFGCGYGALLEYLFERHPNCMYFYYGIDISEAMIAAATAKWNSVPNAHFLVGGSCAEFCDYTVSSGVFNVKMHLRTEEWERYVEEIIADISEHSKTGFSVNFLHDTGDGGNKRLYRTNPKKWQGFIDKLGFECTVGDSYGLREFTLIALRRATA